MTYDLAWSFREHANYTTDPSYAVPGLAETYPHTYTAANGYSSNAGWVTTAPAAGEYASGNDPRLTGGNFTNTGGASMVFQVDLASGSAPGAGTYTVDWALGFAFSGAGHYADHKLFDDTTLLIDATNGGAGYSLAVNHYLDATLADVTATTSWTGATASKTFATTTCKVLMCPDSIAGSPYVAIAHFRLTLQGGVTATVGGSLLLYGLQFDRPASTSGNLTMQADTRAYALTGQDAALRQTQHLTLTADNRPFFLTGRDVAFSFGHHALTATGAFVLTGAAVGLVHGPLPPAGRSGPSPYLEYRRHRRMGR